MCLNAPELFKTGAYSFFHVVSDEHMSDLISLDAFLPRDRDVSAVKLKFLTDFANKIPKASVYSTDFSTVKTLTSLANSSSNTSFYNFCNLFYDQNLTLCFPDNLIFFQCIADKVISNFLFEVVNSNQFTIKALHFSPTSNEVKSCFTTNLYRLPKNHSSFYPDTLIKDMFQKEDLYQHINIPRKETKLITQQQDRASDLYRVAHVFMLSLSTTNLVNLSTISGIKLNNSTRLTSKKVNKLLKAAKKAPTVEHKSLIIKPNVTSTTQPKFNRRLAGTALHSVRGHKRVYKSGKVIYIAPHNRGDSQYGTIEKTDRIFKL